MNSLGKGFRILKIQFKREGVQLRIFILYIMIAVFIYSYLQPVASFSKVTGINVTPWVFPHLVNDFICQMVFMSGVVFLFCTAPFKGENYAYVIYRSGGIAWQAGNILYIILMSLIYTGFIGITSVISLLPHIDFVNEWGKIWGTIAQTDAMIQYRIPFTVHSYLIGVFSPVKATAISFILETACAVWIGLVVYLFNSISKKPAGTLLGAFFVFLDVVIANSFSAKAFLFSPVTLAQLKALSGNNVQYGVTLRYAAAFFFISISCLAGICLFMGAKRRRGRKRK